MTLLCTHHHRCLHEGGFHIARESDGELRFQRADGRSIPRFGYRVEDFIDDDVRTFDENPSAEVRGPAAVYTIQRAGSLKRSISGPDVKPCSTVEARIV